MKLFAGSMNTVEQLIGSFGLIRDCPTSADAAQSHLSSTICGALNGFACFDLQIVLKNAAGDNLLAGGYPITVEVFDVLGNVLLTADNTHLVSNEVVSGVNHGQV
jgi:hypothetical protein